jgi:hypothetical protein
MYELMSFLLLFSHIFIVFFSKFFALIIWKENNGLELFLIKHYVVSNETIIKRVGIERAAGELRPGVLLLLKTCRNLYHQVK